MSSQGIKLPTVIIPVHNAAAELQQCLASVEATVPGDAKVIVIDDASTDPDVGRVLKEWQHRVGENWQFDFQPENLGFVATVNRGMERAQGDVVPPGWLEGLHRCLVSDPAIATATPWTNNGEVASIPEFCAANPPPEHPDTVAHIIAATGVAGYPDLPTAVGFCMVIAHRALLELGLFDAETFGRGYGEENDFSMRAQKAGMRNVLCDDVYVVHIGGRSFGPLGLRPDESSMQRLLSRHPEYLEQVQAFIECDPLAVRREVLISALRDVLNSAPASRAIG
jgi:GT2 family glycosyltransferase